MCRQIVPPAGTTCVLILPPHCATHVSSHWGVLSQKGWFFLKGMGGCLNQTTTQILLQCLDIKQKPGKLKWILSQKPKRCVQISSTWHICSSIVILVLPCRASALPHRVTVHLRRTPVLPHRAPNWLWQWSSNSYYIIIAAFNQVGCTHADTTLLAFHIVTIHMSGNPNYHPLHGLFKANDIPVYWLVGQAIYP